MLHIQRERFPLYMKLVKTVPLKAKGTHNFRILPTIQASMKNIIG